MNKALKVVLCLLGIIIPVGMIFMIVGYEKARINSSELIIYEEIEKNISYNLSLIETILIFVFVTILVISLIHLILILFNILYINKTWYRNLYIILTLIFLSIILTFLIYKYVGKYILVINNKNIIKPSEQSYIIKHFGEYEFNKDEDISYKNFYTDTKNANTILVKSSSNVYLNGVTVKKYGNSTNILTSKIYGINAAILVLKDSVLNIKNSSIDTDAKGSSGLVSTLDNSVINGDMLVINTNSSDSYGVFTSLGGIINIDNSKIKTTSHNSPTINSMKNGKITVNGAILNTNSQGSPLIYTSGVVNLNDSDGDANGAGFAYIDGKSEVKINNCNLKVAAIRYSNKQADSGFYIQNSLLNSKYNESTLLEINDSTLEIKKQSKVFDSAPMFYINNSNVTINISNNEFIYGSNILLTTNSSKKNNKNIIVNMNSKNQKLNGDIVLDSNATLELNYENTIYSGKINENNIAKKVTLNIDSNSKLLLNGDMYIDVIKDEDTSYNNIDSNGYNIYYNSDLNKNLENKKIKLKSGGYLLPE